MLKLLLNLTRGFIHIMIVYHRFGPITVEIKLLSSIARIHHHINYRVNKPSQRPLDQTSKPRRLLAYARLFVFC